MRDLTPDHGLTLWSDRDTTDPGFDSELVSNLRRADTIIFAVSSEGLGRYQAINEISRVVDALRTNFSRRLVLAHVGGAEAPPQLSAFDQFADRVGSLSVASDDASIDALLRACFPGSGLQAFSDSTGPEGELATKLNDRFARRKNLVVVVGPYAFAEGEYVQTTTPATTIERFVAKNSLEGAPPWIDTMGSVAMSMTGAIDERLARILDALRGDETYDQSGLGVYLRLISANWQKTPGLGKLCIINTMPDEWLDLVLGSTSLPVEHVKLINNAFECDTLEVRHVKVVDGNPTETIVQSDDPEAMKARVMLIKPFGSIASEEAARKAMLTAEHWRMGAQAMLLPTWVSDGMTSSVLLVLGAGMYTPNMQMLFRSILPAILEQKDDNPYRYLIHNADADAQDPLHRIESHLIRNQHVDQNQYRKWIWDNYRLEVKVMDPTKLLVWIEHYLKGNT